MTEKQNMSILKKAIDQIHLICILNLTYTLKSK